jgi:hypothetical protein
VTEEHNPFDAPSSTQLAAWTLRLAANEFFVGALMADQHLFALYYAACSTSVEAPDELRSEFTGGPEYGSVTLMSALKDLSRQFGEQASGKYASLYLEGLIAHTKLNEMSMDEQHDLLRTWQVKAEAATTGWRSSQEENIDRLAKLLNLSDGEKRLLTFQLNRNSAGFKHLYDVLLGAPEVIRLTLGLMLGIGTAELDSMLHEDGQLVKSGLLLVQERPLSIEVPSRHLYAVLTLNADSDEEFIERFVQPLSTTVSTASLARFDDRDEATLLKLMTMPVPAEHGLHVLIYGARSIDKNDLLARLFSSHEINAYSVVSKDVPASDFPAWVHVAQCYVTANDAEAVLVVDKAEVALATRRLSFMTVFGMTENIDPHDEGRASDEGLTGSRIRCVWLTNRATTLSEKNLGRFLFHCEARPGSRADRRERIAVAVAEAGLGPEIETHLSKYSLLGENAVRQAARLAGLVHEEGDSAGKEATIKRAVHQSQRVLGRDATEELRDSVTHYDLDMLNLNSRFTPQQIVSSLKKKQRGSLLFHGIPGAGKTQFAEYLAVELDMPILMKRASDILSKWVGESEQHIAEMFQEAEEEDAILFIDEADSFLRDRSLARAEWSVTQVNELLQHLERAPGVVICATNLMDDIDAAAMRRFTFKIEFLPLKPEQAWTMLCVESGFDSSTASVEEVEELREKLFKIKNLAPGDFATCKRMSLIMEDDEPMTIDGWLTQLEQEAKDKMHGLARNKLGFGDR